MGHIHTKIDINSCNFVEDYWGSVELLNWLKDSCIKTKSGADLVCYHGSPSSEKFAIFNDSTSYGCKSFIGFFSLNRDFAECYTYDDTGETAYNRVRGFAINSKKLFDIKNPACVRFLKTHLPDTVICIGDELDRATFVDYLRTEQLPVTNYKLTTDKFNSLEMFDKIGMRILGDSGWNYSCTLETNKQLQNAYFLSANHENNSIFILNNNTSIKPKLDRKYCWPNKTEGILLYNLEVPFNKVLNTGLLTATHLSSLSQGQPVNIKLSAEEFINVACILDVVHEELTEKDRLKLKDMIHNPIYDGLDLSVDVTLVPKKVYLDEFNKGLAGGHVVDKTDSTWKLYEASYCVVDNQKIHIVDWLKNEGFDAIVVKEDGVVNILCFYKNMIKDLKNRMPTDSDSVFENYHYSDALLIDF